MKLVSLNIECNKHYERFLPFLEKENPDVICLQEVLEEDFEYIQEKLGMMGVFKVSTYFASTLAHYKDTIGKKYGVAIFARTIISSGYASYTGDEKCMNLPFEDYLKKDIVNKVHLVLWIDVKNKNGEVYRFATTHFPISERGTSTPYQLESLESLFEKLIPLKEFVLCGDFNAARGNETFTRLANTYKDNIPMHYTTSIDQNLHRMKGIMFMVDGLFTTHIYQAFDVSLVDGVSDHMAIVARIEKKRLDNRC
jgi:endonuclease/exonuclease/phosphatase family metal-dependent hydrolase